MRFGKVAMLLIFLIATWEFSATASHAAGHNQNATAHSSGRSSSSMGKKSSGDSDSQWQADPDRGWVRSDDQRNRKDQRSSAKQNGEKKTKQKDKKWFF